MEYKNISELIINYKMYIKIIKFITLNNLSKLKFKQVKFKQVKNNWEIDHYKPFKLD